MAKNKPKKNKISGIEIIEHPGMEGKPGKKRRARSSKPPVKLTQWQATAICGNDITSSCLYVAAICTAFAGALAPVCLLLVAGLLYLFRKIYGEVVGALPLNGGAYNALLNSTTKFKASMAACMTILSYMATAVISAKTGVAYIDSLTPVPVVPLTIFILAFFMCLTIMGITESARAAMVIFTIHMVTLVTLCIFCGYFFVFNKELFFANWNAPLPGGRMLLMGLFLGFSSGLLGISGFESSANFVEEQAPGVFPKTLRNMWIAVSIFNPLIAFLALGVLPVSEIISEENSDFLLATMGGKTGGHWLHIVVAIDAALVLCGAVLTSFVGVCGLVHRMTLDRCLPQFLLKRNRRGTTHRISIIFFFLCSSIVFLTGGNLFSLAGVYTISFLGVMSLFAGGNILLKVRRAKLPRPERAGWFVVLFALIITLTGLIGNIVIDVKNLQYFITYFIPTVVVVAIMFLRIHILKLILVLFGGISEKVRNFNESSSKWILEKIDGINSQSVIFFTGGDSAANLNSAMLYVHKNELTKRIQVIHIYQDKDKIPKRLKEDLKFLDEVYPEIKIELVLLKGVFNPETVNKISKEYKVAKNYMFIGAPGHKFPHQLEDLGGVRIII